jgi:steroid delta-isomerase-like uncharacterized protein
MSESERVVQAMLESANRHDAEAIHAYLAEAMHAINRTAGVSTASRMHAVQSALLAGFPDLQYRITRTLFSGNTAVIECTVSGTHKGSFAGIAATNKTIDVPAAFCLEILDGKLTDCRSYFDTVTLLEQIGSIPFTTTADVTRVV